MLHAAGVHDAVERDQLTGAGVDPPEPHHSVGGRRVVGSADDGDIILAAPSHHVHIVRRDAGELLDPLAVQVVDLKRPQRVGADDDRELGTSRVDPDCRVVRRIARVFNRSGLGSGRSVGRWCLPGRCGMKSSRALVGGSAGDSADTHGRECRDEFHPGSRRPSRDSLRGCHSRTE